MNCDCSKYDILSGMYGLYDTTININEVKPYYTTEEKQLKVDHEQETSWANKISTIIPHLLRTTGLIRISVAYGWLPFLKNSRFFSLTPPVLSNLFIISQVTASLEKKKKSKLDMGKSHQKIQFWKSLDKAKIEERKTKYKGQIKHQLDYWTELDTFHAEERKRNENTTDLILEKAPTPEQLHEEASLHWNMVDWTYEKDTEEGWVTIDNLPKNREQFRKNEIKKTVVVLQEKILFWEAVSNTPNDNSKLLENLCKKKIKKWESRFDLNSAEFDSKKVDIQTRYISLISLNFFTCLYYLGTPLVYTIPGSIAFALIVGSIIALLKQPLNTKEEVAQESLKILKKEVAELADQLEIKLLPLSRKAKQFHHEEETKRLEQIEQAKRDLIRLYDERESNGKQIDETLEFLVSQVRSIDEQKEGKVPPALIERGRA